MRYNSFASKYNLTVTYCWSLEIVAWCAPRAGHSANFDSYGNCLPAIRLLAVYALSSGQ
jgi:hypothetical protein